MKFLKKLQSNEKLMKLLKITQRRVSAANIGNNSVVVAYYLLLSLFPLMIAVGNLLPFLHIDPNSILPYIKNVIPDEVYQFIGPAIQNLLTQSSGSLLSVSALAAVWSASQSINGLQTAMNRAYGVEDRNNFIVVRIVSVLILVLLLFAIIAVTLVLGVGKAVLDGLQPIFGFSSEIIGLFQTLKWPLSILTLVVIMTVIYWVVPNAKVTFKAVIPGAVIATVGWMILGQVFGIYTMFFASKVSGYQIIGSFIVLMIWLNLAATIVIFGGIVNAIVAEYTTGEEVAEREGPLDKLSTKIQEKISDK